MTFVMRIRKVEENQASVIYAFGPDETRQGYLLLAKATGKVVEMVPVPGPRAYRFFARAAVRVRTYWACGAYPEQICWGAPRRTARDRRAQVAGGRKDEDVG
jgi:hypothetical protein